MIFFRRNSLFLPKCFSVVSTFVSCSLSCLAGYTMALESSSRGDTSFRNFAFLLGPAPAGTGSPSGLTSFVPDPTAPAASVPLPVAPPLAPLAKAKAKAKAKARATAVIQPHRRPLRKITGLVKLKVMPKNSGIKFEVQSPSCPEFRSDFLSLGSTDFPALASWTESERKDGIANLARTIKTRLASFGWKVAQVSKSPSCPVPCTYAFYKEQHSAAINRQIAAGKAHLLSTGMWP